LLGGGPGLNPFGSISCAYDAFLSVKEATFEIRQGTEIGHANLLALSRNGDTYESLAAVATAIASHLGGFRGIKVMDFLLQLVIQLLPDSHRPVGWSDDINSSRYLSPEFCDRLVPFLSPVNDPWDELIHEIDGSLFANLNRTPNQDRIDLSVTTGSNQDLFGISGEVKNREEALTVSAVKDILTRVPVSSWLHIVFCTKLQGNYFVQKKRPRSDMTPWKSFCENGENQLENLCLLKVSMANGESLSLQPLFESAIPANHETYERLVIFIPLEDLLTQ
jgi:hypothetical protein